MINLNRVVLVGRLTKDIELRKTNSNASVCSFTVAVDRRFQSQQQAGQTADFINCIAWRQSADFLSSYASKGTIVSVEGRIQTRSYDGQNGKVYVTEVVADSVQIISNRTGNGMPASTGSYAPQNQTFTPAADPGYPDSMDDDFSNTPALDISSDDLPFY
ncbi:MAG: single-stranded DNA-binding protein [Erysipelotrichaceae bacterium]|nr:single-stranded DNA-binding protein [Erysipelotrichaceae bacterium]